VKNYSPEQVRKRRNEIYANVLAGPIRERALAEAS
jgi:hypothetical protein